MRRNYIIGALLFLVCCQQAEEKPVGILPRQDMVRVLSELYILEEKVARLSLPADSAQKVFELLRYNVFKDAGVPDSVFKKSFDYYMDHPIEMEKVYSVLVDSLQLREQRAPFRPDVK